MKTILVVSSDAGGTIALVPVVREMLDRHLGVHIVASGPAVQIWHEEEISCDRKAMLDTIGEGDAMAIIRQYYSDTIVTGAGVNNSIEHTFRRAASTGGVFSFALVDGWFNLKERFQRECNRLVSLSIPDLIGVMDEASRAEMLEEGFDPSKIVIVGAPHIEETARYVTAASDADVKRLCARFGLQGDIYTAVFFSTPDSSRSADRAGGGPVPGCTQMTILREVLRALSEACDGCGKRVQLVIKPHPRESGDGISKVLRSTQVSQLLECRVIDQCKTAELVCIADAVFGVTSTALMEAAVCGKPALSIQVGRDLAAYPDKYFGNRAGITSVYDATCCRRAVQQFLSRPQSLRNHPVPPVQNGASSRVVEALLKRCVDEPRHEKGRGA